VILTRLLQETKIKYDSNVTFIRFKEEFNQIINSIQARGVIYTLLQLSNEQKRKGVIAVSTGHFAHILTYFGKKFGIPVTVIIPNLTTLEKDKCRDLSARAFSLDNIVKAHTCALHRARTEGLVYIDAYVFF